MYNFTCTPRVITSYLLSIIGILLTANFFVIHRRLVAPDPVLKGLRAAFYFGADANFPGLFTSLLILGCAVILWNAANLSKTSGSQSENFRLMSFFFLLFSLEDFFKLHKELLTVMREFAETHFHLQQPFSAQIISGVFLLVLLLLILTGFLMLPARLNGMFIIACLMYTTGVAIKELQMSNKLFGPSFFELVSSLLQTLGQLLQMSGMLLFLHGLIAFYLKHIELPDIRVTFFPSQPDKPGSRIYQDGITEIM